MMMFSLRLTSRSNNTIRSFNKGLCSTSITRNRTPVTTAITSSVRNGSSYTSSSNTSRSSSNFVVFWNSRSITTTASRRRRTCPSPFGLTTAAAAVGTSDSSSSSSSSSLACWLFLFLACSTTASTAVVLTSPPTRDEGSDDDDEKQKEEERNKQLRLYFHEYQQDNAGQYDDYPFQKRRFQSGLTLCEQQQQQQQKQEQQQTGEEQEVTTSNAKENKKEEEILYHGLFPLRQLWKPQVPYPLWDVNWDGKHPSDDLTLAAATATATTNTNDDASNTTSLLDEEQRKEKHRAHQRYIRKHGITRHIILIRHGQYDERHEHDHQRILTPLGRKQAELTGQRLAEMIRGINAQFGPCHVKVLRVSDMARAKETADIIAAQLPDWVERAEPDALLNEGRPCHTIPGGRVSSKVIEKTDQGHERIEKAFQKYFYRADAPVAPESVSDPEEEEEKKDTKEEEKDHGQSLSKVGNSSKEQHVECGDLEFHPQHEFEIIVCHANVIRYFMCRALQLPPEAWLRMCTFNCSLNYITIRPTGTVSVRMLGDIGHLGYEYSTFSMHHGFNW